VYTYVKSSGGCSLSPELITYRIGQPPERVGAVCAALAAFTELGIIINENGLYRIPRPETKKSLFDSEILRKLNFKL